MILKWFELSLYPLIGLFLFHGLVEVLILYLVETGILNSL